MVQCNWQTPPGALALTTLREISSHSLILDQEMAIYQDPLICSLSTYYGVDLVRWQFPKCDRLWENLTFGAEFGIEL